MSTNKWMWWLRASIVNISEYTSPSSSSVLAIIVTLGSTRLVKSTPLILIRYFQTQEVATPLLMGLEGTFWD